MDDINVIKVDVKYSYSGSSVVVNPVKSVGMTATSAIAGPKGDVGDTGPANTLSIGSVTEGAAAASITGAAPTQTLNLTLPRGNTGAAGYNPMTVSATPPLGASIGDLWYQP